MNPLVMFAMLVFSVVFMSLFAPMLMHYVIPVTFVLFLLSIVVGNAS